MDQSWRSAGLPGGTAWPHHPRHAVRHPSSIFTCCAVSLDGSWGAPHCGTVTFALQCRRIGQRPTLPGNVEPAAAGFSLSAPPRSVARHLRRQPKSTAFAKTASKVWSSLVGSQSRSTWPQQTSYAGSSTPVAMSSTAKMAEMIRTRYSTECWEVQHTDEEDGKVYVAAPREIVNMTEALNDIAEETGATCDLNLTDEGATLTFWVPSSYVRPLVKARVAADRTGWGGANRHGGHHGRGDAEVGVFGASYFRGALHKVDQDGRAYGAPSASDADPGSLRTTDTWSVQRLPPHETAGPARPSAQMVEVGDVHAQAEAAVLNRRWAFSMMDLASRMPGAAWPPRLITTLLASDMRSLMQSTETWCRPATVPANRRPLPIPLGSGGRDGEGSVLDEAPGLGDLLDFCTPAPTASGPCASCVAPARGVGPASRVSASAFAGRCSARIFASAFRLLWCEVAVVLCDHPTMLSLLKTSYKTATDKGAPAFLS